MVELCEFEDRMVPLRLDLNRRRRSLGVGEVAFAQPDWRRDDAEYIGFIKQVLEDLECECCGTQRKLAFDTVAVSTMRAPVVTRQPGVERRRRERRAKPPIEAETSSLLKRGWDNRLKASYLVYSTVRRHLWRHVVSQHHACIFSAGSHLWWHMEGERTTGFCPVAEAFLRWRMHWEACGTPRYLMAPCAKTHWASPPGWEQMRRSVPKDGHGIRNSGSLITFLRMLALAVFANIWICPSKTVQRTKSYGMGMR